MNKRISILLAALLGLTLSLPSAAADIDTFIGSPGAGAVAPQVIILLDNWTNWVGDTPNGTKKITALKNVMNTLAASPQSVNVGLELISRNPPCGPYIRFAPRDMKVL